MDRNFKVCLIISGVMVFLAGLVVVGSLTILFLNRDKIADGFEDWTDDVKQEAERGEQFGSTTDQDGCLDESLGRTEGQGVLSAVPASLFLHGCLESAAPSEGFCDDAPGMGEILATATWTQSECAERGLEDDQACVQIMQRVLRYCHEAGADEPE